MQLLHTAAEWLIHTIGSWGYLGIFILMTLESSLFPIPSELVMIPAGYLASRGEMNFFVINLLGILASVVGALCNYYLARFLGRPIFVRLGKYVGISEYHLEKVETFFHRHGEVSTFVGRLLPVIRHLISIPAGFAKMPVWKLSVFTALGAGIWDLVLSGIGYAAGKNALLEKQLLSEAGVYVIAFIVLLTLLYIVYNRLRGRVEHTLEVSTSRWEFYGDQYRIVVLTDHGHIGKHDTVRLLHGTDERKYHIMRKVPYRGKLSLVRLLRDLYSGQVKVQERYEEEFSQTPPAGAYLYVLYRKKER